VTGGLQPVSTSDKPLEGNHQGGPAERPAGAAQALDEDLGRGIGRGLHRQMLP
jgi:hypothetical protein